MHVSAKRRVVELFGRYPSAADTRSRMIWRGAPRPFQFDINGVVHPSRAAMSAVLMFRCSRQARIRLQSLPVFRLITANGNSVLGGGDAADPPACGRRPARARRQDSACGRRPGLVGAAPPCRPFATIDLAIAVVADPGQGFPIVEHALAIQVIVAGNALSLGNGLRGRGMPHHAVQGTVGRAHEHVGKSPGKWNDALRAGWCLATLSPSRAPWNLGFPSFRARARVALTGLGYNFTNLHRREGYHPRSPVESGLSVEYCRWSRCLPPAMSTAWAGMECARQARNVVDRGLAGLRLACGHRKPDLARHDAVADSAGHAV